MILLKMLNLNRIGHDQLILSFILELISIKNYIPSAGNLPEITNLSRAKLNRGESGSLRCVASGQPGIQSLWTSESALYKQFTYVGNPVSKSLSDLSVNFESAIHVISNISRHFFKEDNATTCKIVSVKSFEPLAECKVDFKCIVFYEKGYEVSNTTTLTVSGLNGKTFWLFILISYL